MTDRRKAWLLSAMMITASASVLAACQTTSPYVERREAESQRPAPAPTQTYEPRAPAAAPSGSISAEPLPPVQPSYTPPAYTPPVYTPPPPAYTPPPAPAPRPAPPQYRTVTTGKVVDAEGPAQVYTVKSGDALDKIADKMGVDRKTLADLNDLESPYKLKPGQKLTGPKSKAKAYVVGSGDTLSSIGRRFSISATALAGANDLGRSAAIRPGQKLVLPSGYKDLGAQRVLVTPAPTASAPAYTPPAPQPSYTPPVSRPAQTPAQAQPSTNVYSRPTATPAPATSAPATPRSPAPTPRPAAPVITPAPANSAQIQALGRGQFIWPVSGRVITSFGTIGTAQRSDGINIAAAAGTTVRASANGKVVYAGPLPDYGNLVLVQHANGFVSIYAHLSRILVKTQEDVKQNQEVGEVGQTGGATEPQLYFEMRYTVSDDRKAPFDPMLLLPRR